MQLRCWQYSGYAPFSRQEMQCESASNFLTHAAQLEIEPKYGMPIIFTKRLVSLSKNPKTNALLIELNQKMESALKSKSRFSVWEFVLSKFSGNKIKSLEFMSAIFQDNTSDRVYPEFAGLSILDQTFEHIGLESLQKTGSLENLFLRVYPKMDSSDLNQNFYHFYSSAFLSAKLKSVGYEPKLASFVSFLFSAMYEFSEVPSQNWPLSDPEKMDPKKHAWKIKDLYQSYLGSQFGADQINALGFEKFKNEMAKNPQLFMKSLYTQ